MTSRTGPLVCERRPKVCKDIGLGLPRLHVLTHESSNAWRIQAVTHRSSLSAETEHLGSVSADWCIGQGPGRVGGRAPGRE
jgi:hypothetical protein